MKRLSALVAAFALAFQPALAANLTPDQLTQAVTIGNTDLLLIYPSGGPMKSVQWSVAKSLMQTALGSVYLQNSNNLSDVSSPSASRSNLGLGSASTFNIGTSGATVPLLNAQNIFGNTQTLFAGTTTAPPEVFQTGSLLTAPTAGAFEYDGSDVYFTNASAVRFALASLFSPPFTGAPTAPTASPGTNTTQLATTAYVATSYAPLASPALTGVPTAPTASPGTNTTQVATTAFVLANNSLPLTASGNHVLSQGSAPSCSTNCSSVTGNDTWMKITGSGAASSVAITFAATWGTAPICTVSPNLLTPTITITGVSTTATGATITLSNAATSPALFLHCGQ